MNDDYQAGSRHAAECQKTWRISPEGVAACAAGCYAEFERKQWEWYRNLPEVVTRREARKKRRSAARAKWYAKPENKEYMMRYTRSEKYVSYDRERRRKPERLVYKRNYNATGDEVNKQKIRIILNKAIGAGVITRPDFCSACGMCYVKIEAHHHKGYAPEFALDVAWLCRDCHEKADHAQVQ